MKITDDYEKFVKQFYSKIYEILGRAFCIFSTILCRVEQVSNLQTLLRPLRGGDLKSGGSRLGSTPKVQLSKHLKLKPL